MRPSQLSYNDVAPGELEQVSSNGQGFEHVTVENIGSERISTITAEATMPEGNPFGNRLESDGTFTQTHDTGNFIQLGLSTANTLADSSSGLATSTLATSTNTEDSYSGFGPHYVNRVEFFEENPPEYINPASTENSFHIGRFREGDVEYFFQVNYNPSASDPSVNKIIIGGAPHTATQLGTTDFTSDGADKDELVTINSVSTDGTQSDAYDYVDNAIRLVSFNTSEASYDGSALIQSGSTGSLASEATSSATGLAGSKVTEYGVFVAPEEIDNGANPNDPAHIYRTRYGQGISSPTGNTTATSTTSGQVPLFDSGTEENQLQPGQNFPINIGVELPQGVDAQAIEEGSVSFFATTGSYSP